VTSAYRLGHDHLLLAVRLTPNGGRDAFDGVEVSADGQSHLKARVTAVPEQGKANKALVALLSKSLKVPKSTITIVSGETSRQKIIRIEGDPEDLNSRLDALASA
jgi:uncharacterized protein (TIGR00251 family)